MKEEVVEHDESDVDQSPSDAERADRLKLVAGKSLQEEANSLYIFWPTNQIIHLLSLAGGRDEREAKVHWLVQ